MPKRSYTLVCMARASVITSPPVAQSAGLALPVPRFTSAKVVGANFVATGTNGAPNGTYNMLTATNVAQSIATWTAVLTNTFDGSGNFSNNIPTNSALPRNFYRIQQ